VSLSFSAAMVVERDQKTRRRTNTEKGQRRRRLRKRRGKCGVMQGRRKRKMEKLYSGFGWSMLLGSKGDRNLNRWISLFERESAQIVIDSERGCFSVIFAYYFFYHYYALSLFTSNFSFFFFFLINFILSHSF